MAGVAELRLANHMRLFELSQKVYICFLFRLQSVEILQNGTVVAGVPHSITFASRSKKNYDVTEALQKFMFLDFYAAALCNLGFMICGSYIEQVWPPLQYSNAKAKHC